MVNMNVASFPNRYVQLRSLDESRAYFSHQMGGATVIAITIEKWEQLGRPNELRYSIWPSGKTLFFPDGVPKF